MARDDDQDGVQAYGMGHGTHSGAAPAHLDEVCITRRLVKSVFLLFIFADFGYNKIKAMMNMIAVQKITKYFFATFSIEITIFTIVIDEDFLLARGPLNVALRC